MRHHRRLVYAVGCAILALLFAFLSVQSWRWQRTLQHGDALFDGNVSRTGDLWQLRTVPYDPTKALLGVNDDVAYRRALGLFWLARPRSSYFAFSPQLPFYELRARDQLTSVAEHDRSRLRRANALNLLGVLQVTAPAPDDPVARLDYINQALAFFRGAIAVDPSTTDAKVNLELALRAARESRDILPNIGGTSGAAGGAAGGAGSLGSGY
jgi:hypothetical protein